MKKSINSDIFIMESFFNILKLAVVQLLIITLINLTKLYEAVTSYKKAIEIKPGYTQAHYNLDTTLHKLENYSIF